MDTEPFFRRERDHFMPTPACRGPWDPNSLHGRVLAGLAAFEIERLHGDPALQPARLTIDLYRLPDFSPITVHTEAIRQSRRLTLVEAHLQSGGVGVARARAQLLRRTTNAEGRFWSPPAWRVPPPSDSSIGNDDAMRGMGGMWALRPIEGAIGTFGPKRAWMSEVRGLIEGHELTPWQRAALAADFASPFANSGDQGVGYINSDITLYLHRLPRGAWIGFDVVNHQATDGVAIGECVLYDREGAIGTSSVAALAQQRRLT